MRHIAEARRAADLRALGVLQADRIDAAAAQVGEDGVAEGRQVHAEGGAFDQLRQRHVELAEAGRDLDAQVGVVAGTGHLLMGNVNLVLLGTLLLGSVPGIVVGSLLAGKLPEQVLRYGIAAILTISALKLLAL